MNLLLLFRCPHFKNDITSQALVHRDGQNKLWTSAFQAQSEKASIHTARFQFDIKQHSTELQPTWIFTLLPWEHHVWRGSGSQEPSHTFWNTIPGPSEETDQGQACWSSALWGDECHGQTHPAVILVHFNPISASTFPTFSFSLLSSPPFFPFSTFPTSSFSPLSAPTTSTASNIIHLQLLPSFCSTTTTPLSPSTGFGDINPLNWTCEVCLVPNKPSDAKCVCCSTPQPKSSSKSMDSKPSATTSVGMDSSTKATSTTMTT
ncbi:unnamed protein product [Pleuronectes platessa]|uniref:RanBP2-type domain-containing protein n=1 Tax=Pleuronectes platessa TaxID=8262 RepID=A0A9N7ZCR8_PLEPL|nr:unnamed protein product [Pleuronectes platessa]